MYVPCSYSTFALDKFNEYYIPIKSKTFYLSNKKTHKKYYYISNFEVLKKRWNQSVFQEFYLQKELQSNLGIHVGILNILQLL